MSDTFDDKEFMLTTIDNPYDPFTQFDEWFAYDSQKNYNTSGYLARIARTSPNLSDKDNEIALFKAMQQIIKDNFMGIHKIVSRNKVKSK